MAQVYHGYHPQFILRKRAQIMRVLITCSKKLSPHFVVLEISLKPVLLIDNLFLVLQEHIISKNRRK